ncbi:hypothetical protein [Fulvimarina sp. MAC3]|uniref:hypothetical protein n=1 Tax=Fulvimarina sp. MAC3 TaxID=3148887 RepID=UPI0031FC6DF8
MAKNLKETDAKQGRSGRSVLIVLIVGVALIVFGYVLVAGIGIATSPDGSLEQTETLDAPENATNAASDIVTPEGSEPMQNDGVKVPE